jgi:hypothetical protein
MAKWFGIGNGTISQIAASWNAAARAVGIAASRPPSPPRSVQAHGEARSPRVSDAPPRAERQGTRRRGA